MTFPYRSFTHRVSVEPFLGAGSRGSVFGPSQSVACFRDDSVKLVRAGNGDEVTSSTTIYTTPDKQAAFAPNSRVTLSDSASPSLVIAANLRTPGILPLAPVLEVTLT